MIKRIFIAVLIFIILFILNQCASRSAPGGGPVDRIPPEVIATFPQMDTTGVKSLEKIILQFSERMEENTTEKSIFSSPPLEFEAEWSRGTRLTLNLSDTLLPDITYVITIGAGAKDLRNNRMEESFQLAFATGDSLDTGEISGKIFGLKKLDGYFVYAYNMSTTDSINPMYSKAELLTMPGGEGKFRFNYLKQGKYRLYVVQDINKNLLLDAAFENVGIPPFDVSISPELPKSENLNFKLARIDTTGPVVSSASMRNNKTGIIRVSEPLKSIEMNRFVLSDTVSGKKVPILAINQDGEEPGHYVFYTAQQDSAAWYFLKTFGLQDTLGNLQADTTALKLSASTITDTTKFELTEVVPKDSSANFKLSAAIEINFTLPIDTVSVRKNVHLVQLPDDTIRGFWTWRDLKKADFKPDYYLTPDAEFNLTIEQRNIRSVWGDTLPDSLISHYFISETTDEYGLLNGYVLPKKVLSNDIYLKIQNVQKKTVFIDTKVDPDGSYGYKYIPDGRYRLEGFIDQNRDGKYSFGQLEPFHFSEIFKVQEDTLRVRKRWERTDIIFKFDEN